jgi:hypothetical protein
MLILLGFFADAAGSIIHSDIHRGPAQREDDAVDRMGVSRPFLRLRRAPICVRSTLFFYRCDTWQRDLRLEVSVQVACGNRLRKFQALVWAEDWAGRHLQVKS